MECTVTFTGDMFSLCSTPLALAQRRDRLPNAIFDQVIPAKHSICARLDETASLAIHFDDTDGSAAGICQRRPLLDLLRPEL